MNKNFFYILPLVALPLTSQAIDISQNQQKLSSMHNQIAALKKTLHTDQQQRATLLVQLAATDRDIATQSQQLAALNQDIRNQHKQLKTTQTQINQVEQKLAIQRSLLSEHVQVIYQLHHEPPLKYLLNQQDPDSLQRQLTYYDYITEERYKLIQAIQQNLDKLQQKQAIAAEHSAQLISLNQQQQKALAAKSEKQQARKNLLLELTHSIGSKDQRLHELQSTSKHLTAIVSNLRKSHTKIDNRPFNRSKGKLTWPLQGKHDALFGQTLEHSQLTWNGDLIYAPEGAQVHAVATGKIVFADWLRGFGLLLIVDHGDGYMSLYGRNQALDKKVGDPVEAGEVIATVGQSGGFDKPALYFEIRHDGKPINPSHWCV